MALKASTFLLVLVGLALVAGCAGRQATSTAISEAEGHADLGATHMAAGKFADAADEYRLAIQIDSGNPDYYLSLGTAYDKQGLLPEAIEAHRRAVEVTPKSDARYRPHLLALAKLLYENQIYADAISVYKAALELAPEDFDVIETLGLLYLKVEIYAPAAELYEKAVAQRPRDAQLRYWLATAYSKMGATEKAIVNMDEAVKLEPGNPDLYWLLGDLYNRAQRYDEAIGAAQSLLAIKPGSAGAHCVWAEALARQGRTADARAEFQKAVEANDPAWSPYAAREIEDIDRGEKGEAGN